jgi:HSP20 family protein
MFRRPFGFYGSASPWREIERMQREMNRLFDEVSFGSRTRVAPSYPAINVWTNEEGAVITAELPGVNPDDIEISVVGETLKLTGSRQPEALPEGVRYHRRERGQGNFARTFQLPFMVESDKVEAVFENGVLHISAPRAEAEKPRKIAVKMA